MLAERSQCADGGESVGGMCLNLATALVAVAAVVMEKPAAKRDRWEAWAVMRPAVIQDPDYRTVLAGY